jgi:hypothetical protein
VNINLARLPRAPTATPTALQCSAAEPLTLHDDLSVAVV